MVAKETAYSRVTWRGVQLTARHRDALRWAERKWQRRFPGLTIVPMQGSWSNVDASAGTHRGAGAVDIRTRHLTTEQRIALVRVLKDAGLAAWYRTTAQGFDGEHIHALDIGGQLGMDPYAKWQVKQYDAGRLALATNSIDRTYRPSPKVRWDHRTAAPVARA